MNISKNDLEDLRTHKILVTATGAGGGAFGLSSLALELPISTTIILRSIADIARSEGEQIKNENNTKANSKKYRYKCSGCGQLLPTN